MARVAALAVTVWVLPLEPVSAQLPTPVDAPRVIVGGYDGVIHPIAAEFVDDLLTRAESTQAEVAILVLRRRVLRGVRAEAPCPVRPLPGVRGGERVGVE